MVLSKYLHTYMAMPTYIHGNTYIPTWKYVHAYMARSIAINCGQFKQVLFIASDRC